MFPFILAALSVITSAMRPIPLDSLAVDQARALHGRRVTAVLVVAKAADVVLGRTVLGGTDWPDGISRTLILSGDERDEDEGDRVTVTGTLRVIEHGGAVVNGVGVEGWVEIRVEE